MSPSSQIQSWGKHYCFYHVTGMSKRNYRLIPYRVIDVNSWLFLYSESQRFTFNDSVSDATSFQGSGLMHPATVMFWSCASRYHDTVSYIWLSITLRMMYYHDGLRIITAERARHSSIHSGTPSWYLIINAVSTKRWLHIFVTSYARMTDVSSHPFFYFSLVVVCGWEIIKIIN